MAVPTAFIFLARCRGVRRHWDRHPDAGLDASDIDLDLVSRAGSVDVVGNQAGAKLEGHPSQKRRRSSFHKEEL